MVTQKQKISRQMDRQMSNMWTKHNWLLGEDISFLISHTTVSYMILRYMQIISM